jgi:phage major head subunit gpT-like protein
MGVVRSGPDYSRITEKGLIGMFRQELEPIIGAGWASQIGMPSKSDQETETYRWLGMTPALREWVGGRQAKGMRVESYQITNKIFEATLDISIDDLRRDKIDAIRPRLGDLATRAAEHWEKLITELIIADGICYDGQNFFDTDHVSGSSGTLQNDLDATDIPAANISTAAKATRDEMIGIITGLVEYMYSYKDDQGEPMNGGAKQFMFMVPVAQYAAAVGAVTDALTASGGTNTLIGQRFKVDVVPNPRLTTDTEVYLFRTDGRAKPFILQSELDAMASVIGAGSEEEFKNRRWLFGVEAIRACGYGLWQHAIKLTLS